MDTFTLTNTVTGKCFEENAMIDGLVYMRLLRYTDAVTSFSKVLEETPHDMITLSYLCTVYCAMNENDKACAISKSAIEYAEKNDVDQSLILRMKCQLGLANLYTYGDYKLANKLFHELLDNDVIIPNKLDHGTLLLNLAYSYSGMGNADKSIELNRKAIAVMEGNDSSTLAVAYNNLGTTLAREKKDTKNGLQYLQKALMMRYRLFGNVPNVVIKENLYLLAHVWFQLGNVQRGKQMAIESYEMQKHLQKINNVKEDPTWNLNIIGYAYLKTYENEQAIEYFKEAIAIKLASPSEHQRQYSELLAILYNNLGYSYHNSGDINAALKNYEKALEWMIDTQTEFFSLYGYFSLKARILYNIGNAHIKQGEYRKAIDNLQRSTELRDEHVDVDTFEALDLVMSVSALATTLSLQGGLPEASVQLTRSLKQLDNIPDEQKTSYLDMGKIYNKIGTASRVLNNHKEAMVYHQLALDTARQIYGKDTESLILLAEVQVELHEKPGTVKHNLTCATKMLNAMHKGQSHPDLEYIDKLLSKLET
ncbi:unnamed protein product [Owenia fusiformis]|uniref:Uncharacterized protein n=1 Tax=Owenia fusiformis TaxID=6347 RepID=A0A8S4Q5V6_OWEFU|nr:unnamed protein product [Owenia fusiformis]